MQSEKSSLLYQCFVSEKELDLNGLTTWYTNIKEFVQTSNISTNKEKLIFGKHKVSKEYEQNSVNIIQGQLGRTTENNKLCGNNIKSKSVYLLCDIPWQLKKCISKLRVGDHKLSVETGRHSKPKVPLAERLCILCDLNTVEDEIHFLINCPAYKQFRDKYIVINPTITTTEQFVCILNSTDKVALHNIGLFINKALSFRTELIKR